MSRLAKFVVPLLAGLLVSCQSSSPRETCTQWGAISECGLAKGKPEEVGLSTERLQRINKVMQSYVDENKLVGLATMVARRGKVAHFECFGMMDKKLNKAMRPDTIFRIYSMSKPITSVAVMMLYEEGHFQLNDPVSKFIPEFKDVKVFVKKSEEGVELTEPERKITIRDLLTHTSGLAYGLNKDTAVDEMYQEEKMLKWDETLEEKVRRLVKLPLANQPGSTWRYSISVDVLGYLVEVVSGKRFDVLLEEGIFGPLGMEDTGFYVPEEKIDRFAELYKHGKEDGLERDDTLYWGNFTKRPRFLSGGGGLVSTASDYIRFCQMMLNGGELEGTRLLGRKTVELMTANHLPKELISQGSMTKGHGFGLGFGVLMDVAQSEVLGSEGEYMWGGAASTGFWIDPEEELIGILMTQFMPYNGRFTREFKVLTYQSVVD
jgi:CubicO group peptidase (beta-lactamase class C family)